MYAVEVGKELRALRDQISPEMDVLHGGVWNAEWRDVCQSLGLQNAGLRERKSQAVMHPGKGVLPDDVIDFCVNAVLDVLI